MTQVTSIRDQTPPGRRQPGIPHAVALTAADVTDRQGALQALRRCQANLCRTQSIPCEGGYTGKPFAQVGKDTGQARYSADRQTQHAARFQGDA